MVRDIVDSWRERPSRAVAMPPPLCDTRKDVQRQCITKNMTLTTVRQHATSCTTSRNGPIAPNVNCHTWEGRSSDWVSPSQKSRSAIARRNPLLSMHRCQLIAEARLCNKPWQRVGKRDHRQMGQEVFRGLAHSRTHGDFEAVMADDDAASG